MNNVQRTEQVIRAGLFPEPVLRFRVYRHINSERHVLAGSDWMLSSSWDSREDAEAWAAEQNQRLDFYLVIDGEMPLENV